MYSCSSQLISQREQFLVSFSIPYLKPCQSSREPSRLTPAKQTKTLNIRKPKMVEEDLTLDSAFFYDPEGHSPGGPGHVTGWR